MLEYIYVLSVRRKEIAIRKVTDHTSIFVKDIGRYVFFTYEEALSALERLYR